MSAETTTVISDLDSETKYFFRVVAVNEFGQGALSEPATETTLEAYLPPAAPVLVRHSEVTQTSMKVSW